MAIEVRSDLAASPLVVATVMAGILATAVLTLAGSRLAAVALGLLGVAWLGVNAQVEGPLLLALSYEHGVVAADLVGLGALLLAGCRLLVPPVVRALRT